MGLNSLDPLDRLVQKYVGPRGSGTYDGPFWVGDPMVSYKYEKYDPAHDYPPDLARAIDAELAAEEASERE
jgi:hypothetical protein